MKISDILDHAADKRLWEGKGEVPKGKRSFSCDAVFSAASTLDAANHARRFLADCGVNTCGFHQFDEFAPGPERQAVRYAWLKFAAHVAREEGL